MNLAQAMMMYGTPDKERFECSYPEWQEKRPNSTFFADFSVADCYGEKAIRDTYKRSFDGWKSNHLYFTELVGCLNHKIWQHYEEGNETISRVYDELWREADAYGVDNFKDDALKHFLMVLD